jgi:biopolymer transport protein ExbD
MSAKGDNTVEVDMVPLIDIISLLLMFLVMVGDMAKSTSSVQMRLPRADQAKNDKEVDTHNRIVVQLKKSGEAYKAIVENREYELVQGGNNSSLIKYLTEQINQRTAGGNITLGPNGEVPFPVKLRIPADAPMREAERVIMTLAQAKLVNVHYAVDTKK